MANDENINEPKKLNGESCRDTIWSLLTGNVPDKNENKTISAMVMVSLLDDTKDCDDYINMSIIRQQYKSFLNDELQTETLYDRAVKGRVTSDDEKFKIAKAHTLHYCMMERHILKSLRYPDWLYYHIFERAQRTLVLTGIVGAFVSSSTVALKFLKDAFRHRSNPPPTTSSSTTDSKTTTSTPSPKMQADHFMIPSLFNTSCQTERGKTYRCLGKPPGS